MKENYVNFCKYSLQFFDGLYIIIIRYIYWSKIMYSNVNRNLI